MEYKLPLYTTVLSLLFILAQRTNHVSLSQSTDNFFIYFCFYFLWIPNFIIGSKSIIILGLQTRLLSDAGSAGTSTTPSPPHIHWQFYTSSRSCPTSQRNCKIRTLLGPIYSLPSYRTDRISLSRSVFKKYSNIRGYPGSSSIFVWFSANQTIIYTIKINHIYSIHKLSRFAQQIRFWILLLCVFHEGSSYTACFPVYLHHKILPSCSKSYPEIHRGSFDSICHGILI